MEVWQNDEQLPVDEGHWYVPITFSGRNYLSSQLQEIGTVHKVLQVLSGKGSLVRFTINEIKIKGIGIVQEVFVTLLNE